MSFDSLAREEFDRLSDADQHTIIDFMKFLNHKSRANVKKPRNNVPFDAFAGGLHYISDYFDETPDGFEEYM